MIRDKLLRFYLIQIQNAFIHITLHCGYALNLAVRDFVKNVRLLSETFGTIKEVCKLLKKRIPFERATRDLSENENRVVHAFCPTR